jgi:hypothetical protein
MAQAKKRKKKPPGGAAGAPPRSEPRVQIFTKFAGCNFQLATRDFDDLFGEGQDAQTDLMPMNMAIQNNASIAPFGGIETRQNLVELFDAPVGKHFTGVATLIGERLYAACDDMTIHHGLLSTGNLTGNLTTTTEQSVTQDVGESWYEDHERRVQIFRAPHNGVITTIYAFLKGTSGYPWVTLRGTNGSIECSSIIESETGAWHTFDFTTVLGEAPLQVVEGEMLTLIVWGMYSEFQIAYDSSGSLYPDGTLDGDPDAALRFRVVQEIEFYAEENVTVELEDFNDTYSSMDQYSYSGVAPGPTDIPVEFTQEHIIVKTSGKLMKARYSVGYKDNYPRYAHVHIAHESVTIFDADVLSGSDIKLNHPVAHEDVVTVNVTTYLPIVDNAYTIDFFEALDDNNWTFLGYADDQLVGMTANQQIWNGPLGDFKLANALVIADPNALTIDSLTGIGVDISAAYNVTTHPYRIGICHTLLNEFGPTLPSTPFFFYANHPTSEWTTTAYVKVSGTVANLTGITAVELYFIEGEAQEPAFLGRVNISEITTDEEGHDHPPATKSWSFNWTGYDKADTSMWTIANLMVPAQNYTTGVPASKMAALDGQLYFWGNTENPYRIWIGGNPGNRFSVSPGTGGGFVDVEPGIGTMVKNVLKFKTQQGAAIVTALCDNPNSQREARYNLVESSISISDEQSIKGWMAEKIAGTVGCKSGNGAVAAGDGLYAVSRYGLAITTLTMEYNSQLQVMYVSDPIAPVFLKQYGNQLEVSVLFFVNGVLYMTFGAPDGSLDNVIFCYDIALKAWWTYTLGTDTPILNMIPIDYEGFREGIGIITEDAVYLLPTTMDEGFDVLPVHEVLIETGELTTMQPLQSMHHLTQLEFWFDYFIGELDITVTMIDQFGRKIETMKRISHGTLQHQLRESIRIDAVVESYKIVMRGQAKMRLTHFIAKLYPKSNRIGMLGGFDSSQSHTDVGSIRRTFNDYNDLKDAIIP